ncbi:MAG TPA: iron-containing alcohol dehydrogenase [Gaiellaceae bacterium]
MIVRWGLEALPEVLSELEIERPLLITSERWRDWALPVAKRFEGVRPHSPSSSVAAATAAATDLDGLVALGGGSAIDTAKAVSAETDLPVVSIPTTYSGAEWTPSFGVRDEERRMKHGGGGARVEGIVYEPELTLGLPPGETAGTALNALAHCAEALYVEGRNEDADREALAGARLISSSLPLVVADGEYLEGRRDLLEGAMHAGAALAGAGLGLAHAMAQALGGRYGLPHGGLNAICLAPALRFNLPVAREEIGRFGDAMGRHDPIARVEELARLGGYTFLRHLGVPEDELDDVAAEAAERRGAKANPRAASAREIAELYRSVW